MRVMVLDPDRREAGLLKLAGVLGGEVLGMQVVGDQLRLHVEEPGVVFDPLPERAQSLVVLHVSDVVAHESVPFFSQTEGVLELSAAGQRVPGEATAQPERCGSVSAGTPNRIRPSSGGPHHGIVTAHMDFAVVNQEVVGDLAQLLERFFILVSNGLVGVVPAGHHERDTRVAQQQVMERRVG